jgi:hypothetical protein
VVSVVLDLMQLDDVDSGSNDMQENDSSVVRHSSGNHLSKSDMKINTLKLSEKEPRLLLSN